MVKKDRISDASRTIHKILTDGYHIATKLWHGEKRSDENQPVIIMGLYHHRNLIGSPSSFVKRDEK